MNRKYQEIKGWCVYAHILPNKNVYFGYTDNLNNRWYPNNYKGTSLEPYINLYGWENIEHRMLIDGLTLEQALLIEGFYIKQGKKDGLCINKQGSGGWTKDKDKRVEHYKQQYKEHREEMLEHQKQYNKEHREEMLEHQKQYYQEHREERKQYQRQYDIKRNSTPERKIYDRVKSYNRNHPDKVLITPAEAKEMYELTGYIPDFIKNDDLI